MKDESKQSEVTETQVVSEQAEVTADTTESGGAATAEATVPPKKLNRFDKFFGITKSGSNFKTEIMAGITTFMAMAYILMVNAGMFSGVIGGDNPYGAAYIATAIGAVAGTILMSLLARMPLAQASGMGINAFIVYTLLDKGTGLTYANCMMFTLIEGVIFVILTVTGLRKKIFAAIPEAVRHAIPVGIGLFIAYIGMQSAGIIQSTASATAIYDELGNVIGYTGGVDGGTISGFISFNVLAEGFTFGGVLSAIVAIAGVIAIAVMSRKKIKGAILWGILGSAALYYIMAGIGYACKDAVCKSIFAGVAESWTSPFSAFAAWGKNSVGKLFTEGFSFTSYLGIKGNNEGTLVVLLITTALSMCMIDMFDTLGTLYGACQKGNLLYENGTPIRMEKMMLSDAIGTCVGAVAGTSTVTTFVESSSGVAAGGKTGFTSLVTAACFLVAMFLSPIAQLIPSAATAPALIWVGVLMVSSITKVDWEDIGAVAVAFITFIVMLLGYSISKGIVADMISYVLIQVCSGKIRKICVPTCVITVLFIAMFVLTN